MTERTFLVTLSIIGAWLTISSSGCIESFDQTHVVAIDPITGDIETFETEAEVPEGWGGAETIDAAVLARTGAGREIGWVVWGESERIAAELTATGATVRGVQPLGLEEAA